MEVEEKWKPKNCHGNYDENNVECRYCFDRRICRHAQRENRERKERDARIEGTR